MRRIPIKFACTSFSLSWNDVSWGCRNSLLEWKDAVTFAMDQLHAESDVLEIELAILDPRQTQEVIELVTKISDASLVSEKKAERNWLIISLAWAFHEREKSLDPLGAIEEIYADFSYPAEIESIVRYMPPTDGFDPSVHTFEECENRLMEKWKKIIGF